MNNKYKKHLFFLIIFVFLSGCKTTENKEVSTSEPIIGVNKNHNSVNRNSEIVKPNISNEVQKPVISNQAHVDTAKNFMKYFLGIYTPVSKKYGGKGPEAINDNPDAKAAAAVVMSAEEFIYEGSLSKQILGAATIVKMSELAGNKLSVSSENLSIVARNIDPTIPGVRL